MMDLVLKKIQEIEIDLSTRLLTPDRDKSLGILAGHSGLPLFYYAKFLLDQNDDHINRIEQLVINGFEYLETQELTPYICSGVSGFATMLRYLNEHKLFNAESAMKDSLMTIDNYLFQGYEHALRVRNFDFLHGSEGLLNYFMSLPDNRNAPALFLKQLSKAKDVIPGKGIGWKSNINLQDGNKMVYNLGLAHGMASTMIMLSKIVNTQQSSLAAQAKELLKGVVDFFMSEKMASSYNATFPNYSSLDEPVSNSRLGWCYGDLGIVIALLKASHALQDDLLRQDAVEICLRTTTRKTQKETAVMDATICHGTAGIAHIYSRMFQLTGKIEFQEASQYWIDQTLKKATYEDGNAGYKMWTIEGPRNGISLLEGSAGIGLVLMSTLLNEDIDWDNSLLTN